MQIEIKTTNAQEMLMDEIFSQFEETSQELEMELELKEYISSKINMPKRS